MKIGEKVLDAVRTADWRLDIAKQSVKSRLGLFDPVQVLPFKGYGTREKLILTGRVLEESGVAELDRGAGFWKNVLNSLERFDSDEIPGAIVEARYGDERWSDLCDHDGYFRFEIEPQKVIEEGWVEVEVGLIASIAGDGASGTARVLVPSSEAEFMIISDIDDTVIETGAMDTLRMVRTVLFQNAHQRTPFPGVVSLYNALLLGPDEKGRNPIFYLSRSGWPLFDLFNIVFRENEIPEGPLLLRDLGILEKRSPKVGSEAHKLDHIRRLLEIYDYPVVLIGDSGQEDPEIYHEILTEYADRIEAIYFRHVVGAERARQIERMYKRNVAKLCVAPSTIEMARHAVDRGLISENQLELVRQGLSSDLAR
ncbi:MAG: phosphatase domain-containing protein [Thermoanaerobaculia bacterium]|nr:phosphatase domain-containing protein [Thermoanaerobaculia bacterium]